MFFPFLDYQVLEFSTTGVNTALYTMIYKAMVVVEAVNFDRNEDVVWVDDTGSGMPNKLLAHNTDITGIALGGGTDASNYFNSNPTVLNSGEVIRMTADFDNTIIKLHIFRLPETP